MSSFSNIPTVFRFNLILLIFLEKMCRRKPDINFPSIRRLFIEININGIENLVEKNAGLSNLKRTIYLNALI